MKLNRLFPAIIVAIILAACSDNPMTYRFIGDSIVTRWDLQASFPTLVTFNCGKSGSGVEHIKEYAGKCPGETAVIMCGTNNSSVLSSPELCAEYAREYVQALVSLRAQSVYVFPVLPRHFQGNDEPELNTNIKMMNRAIRSEIESLGSGNIIYLDVYDDFLDKDGKLNVNLSYDGLHLNPEGYEILTDKLNKEIL